MRTKKKIANDYRKFLVKKGFDEKGVPDKQVLEILEESLYDTEKIRGKKVSSMKAWWTFCNFVVKEDPVTKNEVWNKFVKEMFEIIEHHKLCSVMAPRGAGKSFVSFCLYTIFKTYLFENLDVLIVTNIPKMAKRNLRNLKRIVDNNELLIEKKDDENLKKLKWGEKEIKYNKGYIETVSVGSSPRSAHVPLIIVDDPLREDNKYSDEYIKEFVLGTLLPCVGRTKGRMVVQGTPQSYKDLFHHIMNTEDELGGKVIRDGRVSYKGFYSKVFDAIEDISEKKAYLPEVYDWDTLQQIKKTQGEIYFNREYRCRCLEGEAKIFPISLIKKCVDPDIEPLENGKEGMFYVIGADFASSASNTADYTAFVVIEYVQDQPKKVVKIVNRKMTAEEQEDELIQLARDFNDAYVLVEKNNMGEFLRQRIESANVNVEGFTTTRETKQNAIRYLRAEIAKRRLLFPVFEGEFTILRDQLTSFGHKYKRGRKVMEALTGHDDVCDSLWIANYATQKSHSFESKAICM